MIKKKILYIGPLQPAYHDAFMDALKNEADEVVYFPLFAEVPYTRNISKLGLYPKKEVSEKRHYEKLLPYKDFNYILVRHGFQISADVYAKLKINNPSAKFINFHWDSLKSSYNYLGIMKHYNRIFSFDINDCKENPGVEYLPLFFIDEYDELRNRQSTIKPTYDLLFVGSWRNMERYKLITKAKQFCTENGLTFKYYLYLNKLYFFNSLLKGKLTKEVKFKMLSHKKIVTLFSQSKVIIDFSSSFQSGLTMRTFETLGSGKKLITTNKNIMNEPFYNRNFISVISQDEFRLDIAFIKNESNPQEFPNMQDYSIHSYIHRLLE